MKFSLAADNIVRLSSNVKTAGPDATRALEAAWLKRRQELGEWRPSNGWLVDQKQLARRAGAAR